MSVGSISSAAVADPGLRSQPGRDERIAAAEARLEQATADGADEATVQRVPVGSLGSIIDVYL
jgi:hypothetical protein